MFFLHESIHPQIRRRLTLAWQAATVGLNKLPKNEVVQLDVVKLCEDVNRFLHSNSSDPKKRLSLRLSAMLTHGTVLIWNRQIKFCLDGVLHFFIHLQEKKNKNMELMVIGGGEIPKTKTVVKRPREKKRKIPADSLFSSTNLEIDISPEAIEQLFSNEQSVLSKTLAEITLREDEPLQQKNDPQDDWFGEQPRPLSTTPGVLAPEIRLPAVQSKDIATIATEEPEHMPIVSPEQANKENEPIPLPPMPTGRKPDRSAQLRAPKKVKNFARALCVKRTNPKVVPINCYKERVYDDVNYTELSKNMDEPLPQFFNFENFWQGPVFVDGQKGSTFLASGPSDVRNIRSVSRTISELNEAFSNLQPDTPAEVIRSLRPTETTIGSSRLPTPNARTVDMIESLNEDLPPAAANGRRRPVEKIQRMPGLPSNTDQAGILSKQQKEIDQSINASIGHDVVELHEQVQVRSQETSVFGGKWADQILALMRNYPRLTPVEICQHLNAKMSKLNMATIFASLLALAKNGSVTLHSFPDSNEFEYAEKKRNA
ncbi:uncharacterized protein LOC109535198 [Dendroctonus ponderosae]|uniref:uncharacterized protein LOC109535198 n=1 Tax=Dendroctonus ponderosae TaxID=77166 RepID=UPI0020353B49|nr:uncharacterized protein LOC109535198 [Dendroctonus ponderosae]XP_048522573.1 uncharacterized protein LOC109535198 [Dendroctonus ponderosae]